MPTSLLLVEDDYRLANLVVSFLEKNDFRVKALDHGDKVIGQVRRDDPELIILDVGLPGKDGFELCRELRQFYTKPILILTARESDIDQVLGLELGADDYIIKPIEPRVLLARVRAQLRRAAQQRQQAKKLVFGGLEIELATRSVKLVGNLIELSSHEFDLLVELSHAAGQVQSREILYQNLYNRPYDGLDRTLDVRVSHLRKKLGDDTNNPSKIKTVWGKGYMLVKEAWE